MFMVDLRLRSRTMRLSADRAKLFLAEQLAALLTTPSGGADPTWTR
jgi:hypothetical protein